MRVTLQVPMALDAMGGLAEEVRRAIGYAVRRAAIRIERECRVLMPIRTGRLRGSFEVEADEGAGAIEMRWGAPYAEVVDLGSQGHWIEARDAEEGGKLRFIGEDGEVVYRSRVWHGGFEGRFYRMVVGQAAMQILQEEMVQAMARVRVVG